MPAKPAQQPSDHGRQRETILIAVGTAVFQSMKPPDLIVGPTRGPWGQGLLESNMSFINSPGPARFQHLRGTRCRFL